MIKPHEEEKVVCKCFHLTEEDIKASFKHGVLSLDVPKKEQVKVPEKKMIMIEG